MFKKKYSYQGTKLIIHMPIRHAKAYNSAMRKWFKAQRNLKDKLDRDLNYNDIMNLHISLTNLEANVWNTIAKIVNKQIELGLVIHDEDCLSDYLIDLKTGKPA